MWRSPSSRSSGPTCCRRPHSPTRRVLDWELDQIFRGWICAGHISAVDEPGKFLVRELGTDSVLIVGGEDGVPRAFLNVCRHRGARLVEEPEGQVRKRLRCPYHAWSYDVNGELRAAPHMDGVEDFDFSCNGLLGVRLAVVGGLVLIDLSGEAPDPDEHVGELLEHLDRYRLTELRRGGDTTYEVAANWKGIAENYNECLHCPGVHPELNALSHYMSGEEVDRRGSLVRRLDDPARGRLDDGARGRRPHGQPAADRGPHRGGGEHRPLLRPVPERARLPASGLRDAAHPVAAVAGRDPRHLRVVLRAGDDGP